MKTVVNWQIHNYCTSGCDYCPKIFWGGDKPRHIDEYLEVAKTLIDHYDKKLGRNIDWIFNGGDPLEFFDFPALLKLCKENNGHNTLHTAGGKLWMDWWAIEPHVDFLNLTCHSWQNLNLIKFIVRIFQTKNKPFHLSVPIRPDFFDEDLKRIDELESSLEIKVEKEILYVQASKYLGRLNYTKDQLIQLLGEKWILKNYASIEKTFEERSAESVQINPVFTGKLCNTGIERINISGEGWARGSDCNNSPLGNIFDGSLELPSTPQSCKMEACISPADQKLTKFE